jgi:hypothetical protein
MVRHLIDARPGMLYPEDMPRWSCGAHGQRSVGLRRGYPMNRNEARITDPGSPPDDARLAAWMGRDAHEFWIRMTRLIDRNYPGIFSPEWLYGGKKHGWSLRYKKGRSFCTLIPERDRFALQIVFGAHEREKAEALLLDLSERTREDYAQAPTYHDGKWLLLTVDSNGAVEDAMQLLSAKRRPGR